MRTQSFPSTQLWSWESSALIVRVPRGPTRFFRERAGGSVTFPRQNSRYVRRGEPPAPPPPGEQQGGAREPAVGHRARRAGPEQQVEFPVVQVLEGTLVQYVGRCGRGGREGRGGLLGRSRAERGAPRIVGPAGRAAQGLGWLRRPVRAA